MCARRGSDNSTLNFESSQISDSYRSGWTLSNFTSLIEASGMSDPDWRKKYELWEIPNSFELGSHTIGKLLISLV